MIACASIESPSLAAALTTTFFPATTVLVCTRAALASGGGFFVRNASACHEPASLSPGRHETLAKPTDPGASTVMRERYSSDGPGGEAYADTVERPPPPASGTQPSSGWNAC